MVNNKSQGDSWGAATPLEDWLDWTLVGGEHHFLCSFFFLSFFFLKDLCNICSNRAKMWDGPKEQNLSPGLNTFCGTHVQARVQRAGFCPLVGFLPKDVRVPSFHLIKAWRRLET